MTGGWMLAGYSVPFTNKTRTRPRTITGIDLRVTLKSLEGSEEVRYKGSLIKGIAEIIPCEKTKEPTPRSICGLLASK